MGPYDYTMGGDTGAQIQNDPYLQQMLQQYAAAQPNDQASQTTAKAKQGASGTSTSGQDTGGILKKILGGFGGGSGAGGGGGSDEMGTGGMAGGF